MLPVGDWLIEDTPRPEEIAEERELHDLILGAVRTLPAGDRDAALLFYYGQRSLQEVAALLGISVTAVKGRLRRARVKLWEQLSPAIELEPARPVITGRKDMTKVKVEDVRGVRSGDDKHMIIVVLADEARQTFLPIWVGEHEGTQLAMALRHFVTPRPLTATLTANLLNAAGAALEGVRIEALKENVFYAVVMLSTASGAQEVDARPSDALTLAAQLGKPIYASVDVLKAAGFPAAEFAKRAEAQGQEHGTTFSWAESESLLTGETTFTHTGTGPSTQPGK